ncbi:hypothetical protein [Sphingomonas alpina]|uniref:Uncharacterized protein n=1 Tax=Sphingomonas alpina TaxID=653931 RepID=A0A7H0LPW8_9SPHN|nr:hypothetical protein [Sphingomonas alpina]QNQ11721.1 hypothetical protein H3Z74_11625 [Sphingomonas alpina]
MRERFELRRQSDSLVYVFERRAGAGASAIYERNDKLVEIVHDPRFGWSTWNREDGALSGRAWDIPSSEQPDFPPEGIWVSRKGAKSYVYELVYVATTGDRQ